MKYLLMFFVPPAYLFQVKKKGPGSLNLTFYIIAIVCHLLGLLTIIFGIGFFFFLIGLLIWSICVGHAGYYMRQEDMERQAELIASKMMHQEPSSLTPERVKRLDWDGDPKAVSEGWHPDPYKRFEQRYYDGSKWTEHVYQNGEMSTDQGELKLLDTAEKQELKKDHLCETCGTHLEPADRFCPGCGAEVQTSSDEESRCVVCGTISTQPTKFCGECGEPFSGSATA